MKATATMHMNDGRVVSAKIVFDEDRSLRVAIQAVMDQLAANTGSSYTRNRALPPWVSVTVEVQR